MTLTLTADIDAQMRYLTVTGTVPDSIEGGYRFRLGDEALELQGFVMPQHTITVDRNRWYVRRAQDGSAAATHTTGTEIKGANDAFISATSGTTPPNPFAGGGPGGSQTLAQTLALGNDADGLPITNAADGVDPSDVATVGQLGGGGVPQGGPLTEDLLMGGHSIEGTAADVGLSAALFSAGDYTGGQGAPAIMQAGDGLAGESGGDAALHSGYGDAENTGDQSIIAARAGVGPGYLGAVDIYTAGSSGTSGQALVSDGSSRTAWGGIYAIASGVPSGAPVGKLPIAVDTTAVTGGIYVWNGSAWVKAASV